MGGAVEVNVTFHLVETSISMKFQKCENVTATYEKFWNFQKPHSERGPVSEGYFFVHNRQKSKNVKKNFFLKLVPHFVKSFVRVAC